MVITSDSDSGDLSSNLGRTCRKQSIYNTLYFLQFFVIYIFLDFGSKEGSGLVDYIEERRGCGGGDGDCQ